MISQIKVASFLLASITLISECNLIELSPTKCTGEDDANVARCAKCVGCDKGEIFCSQCQRRFIRIRKHMKCVCRCEDVNGYFQDHQNKNECLPCSNACDSGCNGSKAIIDHSNGCIRCKYGIIIKEQKICLELRTEHSKVCRDNNYTNFYLENASGENKEWTNHICRKCDDRCNSCISPGNNPFENKCSCNNYFVVDGTNFNCSTSCPTGFQRLPAISQDVNYTFCTNCNSGHFDVDKRCCAENGECIVKNSSEGLSFWSWFLISFLLVVIAAMATCLISYMINKKSRARNKKRRKNKNSDSEATSRRSDPESSIDLEAPSPILQKLLHVKTSTMPTSVSEGDSEKLLSKQNNNFDDIPCLSGRIFVNAKEIRVNINAELGSGEFGCVYKGRFQNKDVAVKVLMSSEEAKKAIRKEAQTMDNCKHDHILSIVAISADNPFYIVTELQSCGLSSYMKNNEEKIELYCLYLYCAQIALGMDYLEQRKILHSDLAARNILLKNPKHVLVADFGLSKVVENELGKGNYGKLPYKWLSIECLSGKMLTFKNDVWEYGVTCWEIFMFCREAPYTKLQIDNYVKLYEYLEGGGRLERPEEYCDKNTFWKISECWNKDPSERPKFKKLYNFFKGIAESIENECLFQQGIYDDSDYESDTNDSGYEYNEDEDFEISFEFDSQLVSYDKETSISETYINPNEFNYNSLARSLSVSNDSGRESYSGKSNNDELSKEKDNLKKYYKDVFFEAYNRALEIKLRILQDFQKVLINRLKFADASEYVFDPNELIRLELDARELEFDNIIAPESIDSKTGERKTEVGKYRYKSSDQLMAVKRIKTSQNLHQTILEYNVNSFIHEIKRLQEMSNCENIVKFYGFCFDNNYAMICMELMDFSLKTIHETYVSQNKILPERFIIGINSSILNALEQCSLNAIMHRNVQPENVLVSKNGMIKLGDLRMSSKLYELPENKSENNIFNLGYLLFVLSKGPSARGDIYYDDNFEHFEFANDESTLKLFRYGHDFIKFVQACKRCRPYDELKKMKFYEKFPKEILESVISEIIKEIGM